MALVKTDQIQRFLSNKAGIVKQFALKLQGSMVKV